MLPLQMIPIIIQQEAPRREITEDGITYREVRPGDDDSLRAWGVIFLFSIVWIGLLMYGMNQFWDGWTIASIAFGPFVLVSLWMIIFGGK